MKGGKEEENDLVHGIHIFTIKKAEPCGSA